MNSSAVAIDEVTGAILTGGKSRRLGRDKVLLPHEGKPLALHMHDLLRELFPRVILIGHARPELKIHGLECVEDLIPGKGVLGGIYTALNTAHTPHIFVAGADMPFITRSIISAVVSHRNGPDAVVPRGPRGLEPLWNRFAHYTPPHVCQPSSRALKGAS
jgi:molybdopterin-guanine dinucleotide biosynthesis protein A